MAERISSPVLVPRLRTQRLCSPVFDHVAELISVGEGELLEPCGAHHPAWLASCLGQTSEDAHAEITTIRQGDRVAGMFAIDRETWRWGWPQRVMKSWRSDLTFDGTPLIDRSHAQEAITGFIAAMKGSPILFETIPADGPFLAALTVAAGELSAPVRIVRKWQRAALKPEGSFGDWFARNFERKRRKEYRRIRARLGEQGRLESLSLADAEPVGPWIDELLALEAKGWKGKRGTAAKSDPRIEAALTKALRALAREGSLRFWKLALDGRPIAMMFALVTGGKAWLGKIAYDEDFARYSPGVLLILDATEALFKENGIALVDSCAIPGHPMIDNIWRDRISMCDVLVGAPGTSQALFAVMAAAENARHALRERAKHLLYRITRRHMS
jgi:CelD/BcsL family acetyltransferase involved in cellulose biosynthesis